MLKRQYDYSISLYYGTRFKGDTEPAFWRCEINAPGAPGVAYSYHGADAKTPQEALLLAAQHWVNYEANKND